MKFAIKDFFSKCDLKVASYLEIRRDKDKIKMKTMLNVMKC